ncbi:pantoate--beta-alanine ligase [Alphaproteobacteria bacterium HT1-32]|nr:pantoate--beta-alanine ligase [Alphaproteobacteria bacterium HT1-32]
MAIEVVTTRVGLRERVASWRAAGETVALVPTMGFLHDGHMSLVDIVKGKADRVVASLFVNPTQFSPSEDLATYPRDQEGDLAKFEAHAVDAVYIPDVSEMYPTGFATSVAVSGFGEGLCAETRPIFFQGVATVVSKLLIQCWPDYAIFGEKDYQQLCVIRRMALDLDIPTQILAGPTVREADGLAMSSRNAYLTPEERRIAPVLNRELLKAAVNPTRPAIAAAGAAILDAGFRSIDYVELRDAETLQPVTAPVSRPARLLAAAWLGKARLIDNVAVAPAA